MKKISSLFGFAFVEKPSLLSSRQAFLLFLFFLLFIFNGQIVYCSVIELFAFSVIALLLFAVLLYYNSVNHFFRH